MHRNAPSSRRRARRRKRSVSMSTTQILKIDHGPKQKEKPYDRHRTTSFIGLSKERESNKENSSFIGSQQNNEMNTLIAFFRKNKQLMNTNRIIRSRSNANPNPKRKKKNSHRHHHHHQGKDGKNRVRKRSGSFSQSAALYNRTDEHRLLHRLQNERFNIKRDPCSATNSRLQFTIGAREQQWNTDVFKQWIKQYRSDKQSFRSIETFAIMKLNELSSNEGKLRGIKNRLKTAVCCDLVQDLMDSHMMSISRDLKHQLKLVLFQSIYTDLPIESQPVINIKHFVAAMPYYILSRRMVKELERTPLIDPENELNMKTLRGAISIKEKCELLAALKKEKEVPILHIFQLWKEFAAVKVLNTKKAKNKLRRLARILNKSKCALHFDAWRSLRTIKREEEQQQKIFELMRSIKKVKAEHNTMVASLRKAEEKKKHLQKMLNQQQRKAEMAPFLSPDKLTSQTQFERQLEDLGTLQTEYAQLPNQLNHAGVLMDNFNPNEDLSKLFDEEIALRWLAYQLKQILIIVESDEQRIMAQMEEWKKYDHDGNTPESEEMAVLSPAQSVTQCFAEVKAMLSPRGKMADLSPSVSRQMPMSPKGRTDCTESFMMVIEQQPEPQIQRDVTKFSTPHKIGDATLTLVNLRKMKRILHNLFDSGLDDFDHDFEGGTIWLVLLYFLFDTATFESFRDLLNFIKLADPMHRKYYIVADKLVSLCTQYLDPQHHLRFFINAANFQSNSNILNFVLLIKCCLVTPNMELQSHHIAKTQLRIESSMGLVRAVMSKLTINISNELFQREMKNVDGKIKEIRSIKDTLWTNHRKWEMLQNRFENRLLRELHNYQRGKISFLYEPSYPHYIIHHITHIPLQRVQSLFRRYAFNSDKELRTEFGLTLKSIKHGMGVIYALLKKYTSSNGRKLTFSKWNAMVIECQLINTEINKRNGSILHQLFVEICESTQSESSSKSGGKKSKNGGGSVSLSRSSSSRRSKSAAIYSQLQCYEKFAKSVSESFHRVTAQLHVMDMQHFGVLLLYLSEIRYFQYSKLTPSVKMEMLLQQHLLPLVHPKSDILAIANQQSVRLLRRQKSKQLQNIWLHCMHYKAENHAPTVPKVEISSDLVDTVTVDSVIKMFTPYIDTSCYSHLVTLCQTCADYHNHTRMDDGGLFQVICFLGQMVNAQKGMCREVDQSIALFIDQLA